MIIFYLEFIIALFLQISRILVEFCLETVR